VIDASFTHAIIWVQLKTWDVSAMRDVVHAAGGFEREAGGGLRFRPAGIAYLNLVWNDSVLSDVLRGFAIALIAVLVVLAVNFRSIKWALVSYSAPGNSTGSPRA